MGVLGELDLRLFRRVAAARFPAADPALRRLSHAADHGRLWFGAAAGLAFVGGRTARRAALRGTGSLVLASLTVNTVIKWSTRRPRPLLDHVPRIRHLGRQPHATSFPSDTPRPPRPSRPESPWNPPDTGPWSCPSRHRSPSRASTWACTTPGTCWPGWRSAPGPPR